MLRAFAYGLLTSLGVAAVYGVAWAVLALSWGLLAVALGGGWLIAAAIRRGVASQSAVWTVQDIESAAESASPTSTRGMSTVGALFGAMAWIVGSFVAFAIVQLATGSGALLDRLTPDKFAAHMSSTLQLEPTWLQPAVLAVFVITSWLVARPTWQLPARR